MTASGSGSEVGTSPAMDEDPSDLPAGEEIWSFTPPKRWMPAVSAVATLDPPMPGTAEAIPAIAPGPAERPTSPISKTARVTGPAGPAQPALVAPPAKPTIATVPPRLPAPPVGAASVVRPAAPSLPASVPRPEMEGGWSSGRSHSSATSGQLKAFAGVALILALLVGAVAVIVPRRGAGAHPLGLALRAGHDYRFLVSGNFEGTVATKGSTRSVSETVEGSLAWHVVSLNVDGEATVRTTLVSTSHRVNGQSRPGIHVVSRILVGRDGRVVSVTGPTSGPDAFGFALRQMGPLLPSRPSKPGATWGLEFDQEMVRAGETVRVSARSTLVRYDVVDGTSTAVVTSAVSVPASSAGKGSIYQRSLFDPVEGQLVESSIIASVDLSGNNDRRGDPVSRTVGTVTLQIQRQRKPAGGGSGSSSAHAADALARDLLRRGLSAADVFYTANRTYKGLTPQKASSISASIRWMHDGKAEPSIVTIRRATASSVLLVTVSDSGTRYCIARTGERIRYGRLGATSPSRCRGGW